MPNSLAPFQIVIAGIPKCSFQFTIDCLNMFLFVKNLNRKRKE